MDGTTDEKTENTAARNRLLGLDLLRLFAALSVTGYHYRPIIIEQVGNGIAPYVSAFRYGYMGVELFFVISGFVIALSVQGRTARSFLVHRAVRLYPAFWVALIASSVTAFAIHENQPTWSTFAANLTMLPGYLGSPYVDGVYWTLAVEWKFYAIMAMLVLLRSARRLDVVGAIWCLVLIAQHVGLAIPGFRSLSMFPYGAHFAFGMLIMNTRVNGATRLRIGALTMASAAMVLGSLDVIDGFVERPTDADRIVVACICASIVLVFVAFTLRTHPGLERAWFQKVGALTYPLYLTHAGVGYAILRHWKPVDSAALSLIISILAVLLLSALITWAVELWIVPTVARSAVIARIAGVGRQRLKSRS